LFVLVLVSGEYITFVSGLEYSNWRKKMGRISKEKKWTSWKASRFM